MSEDELIKNTLNSAKTIAMVGVSSFKKEISTNIKTRPSTIWIINFEQRLNNLRHLDLLFKFLTSFKL